ncbi:MAG TPA: hypothetical protein VKG26_01740 [Bacteroidia bacterium]|nr:hypothetical protein [Bacteroidia bacterium]
MKIIFYTCLVIITLVSCSLKKNSDPKEFLAFSILRKSITDKIHLIDSKCFLLNPNYTHPKHCYFFLTGSPNDLLKFIESMHLFKISQRISDSLSDKMNVYQGKWLWSNNGYHESVEDTIIRKKWNIIDVDSVSYAAYIDTRDSNKVYINPSNEWNGKITAILKKDTCAIFIEELFDSTSTSYLHHL